MILLKAEVRVEGTGQDQGYKGIEELCASKRVYVCVCVCAKSLQSCPTLCDLMDTGFSVLPGFSVHGILQARILEWVAMPSSRGSSRPRD